MSHDVITQTVIKLIPQRKRINDEHIYLPTAFTAWSYFQPKVKYERLCDSSFLKYNLLSFSPSVARESIWSHLIEQDAPVCAVWYCMVSFSSTLSIMWQRSTQIMFPKYVKHVIRPYNDKEAKEKQKQGQRTS